MMTTMNDQAATTASAQDILNALRAQRDQALDGLVMANAEISRLRRRVGALEKELVDLAEEKNELVDEPSRGA